MLAFSMYIHKKSTFNIPIKQPALLVKKAIAVITNYPV
jgi:hypothetical protein